MIEQVELKRLRELYLAEGKALNVVQRDGAREADIDAWLSACGKLNRAAQSALPALLNLADQSAAKDETIARMREALSTAAGWFDDYAREHYAKAKNAPDYREQNGREVKGKTNADRAKALRTALEQSNG